MDQFQFQSKAEAIMKPRDSSAEEPPTPASLVLGACIHAVSIHCDRASSRRRIYNHIMDHCRMTGQNDALNYGAGLDPLYDTILLVSNHDREAAREEWMANEDDNGSGDHPYQVANQTVDISRSTL